MFFLDLSNCGPSGVLRVIYFFKMILDIVFIIVPIGLIIMLLLDFSKAVVTSDDDKFKAFKFASKRILVAIMVFMVPTIVGIFNSILGDLGFDYSICYENINLDAINQLEAEEIARENAEETAQKKYDDYNQTKVENENQILSNLDEDYSTNGCDGLVYFENGIFYKPSSKYNNGTVETKGSAAYGYNIYFYDMLNALISDGAALGHKITASSTEYGAWRPFEKQQYFYNCYKTGSCNNGNLAATPGTSNHGWGIASDLKYGNNAAKKWAHENAGKYGLAFTVKSEDWHIAPAITKVDDSVVERCS